MLISVAAFADNEGGAAQTTTVIVVDQVGDVFIPDASIRLYRVAAVTETGALQAEPAFENSGVSLSMDAEESWSARAITLESYVVEQAANGTPIAPVAEVQTDIEGEVEFTDLPNGLYLLVGEQVTIGDTIYTPLASLFSLPADTSLSYGASANLRDGNLTIYVKNSSRTIELTYTELSVMKVWKDDGHENQRPQEVTVTLYADDAAFDTVTLNADNNWRYTWTELSDTTRWHVTETTVPEHYTVTSVQDGTTFVVTNTYAEDTPTPSEDPKLPQTGQLWWPVTILSMCGLAMILVGIGIRRRGNDRHEAE
jgi:hypothetical protein